MLAPNENVGLLPSFVEPAPKVNVGFVAGFSPELPPKVKPEVGFETPLAVVVEINVGLASVVVSLEPWPKVNVDVFGGSADCPVLLLPNVNPELEVDLEASLAPNVKPLVALV